MSLAIAPPPEPGAPDDTPRYTIGEVVARTGLSADTLRWYERIGLLERPARSRSGQRRFSDRDLTWMEFLGKLRLTAMPVADMVRYAELRREGESTAAARQALLEEHREAVRQRIADLQATLLIIDHKIDAYAERQQQ
ncbi:MerR family transcriptional regulator [Streptacidiphilus sp. P02-A3a]|uniref:MerR family transcriptional regulator n=1 Tax=Streptacidiphilus sp. P02-A3a TaxID=2704468 RepID=UPI0015FDB9E3|nr:MerR family transcriptional regulator [Streptacidiphilus sp. P02-A3a]QMU68256.1 MerR family transcriptional regulator [Streptacidiphilus sp. P02-A3a]